MTKSAAVTRWIGGVAPEGWEKPVRPAPYFRRVWTRPEACDGAVVRICGLGFYELYLNGAKVGDHVLDPIVTQYDHRVRFVSYDVTALLRAGDNCFGVILGNGWYNCHTHEVWNFENAPWRDQPKLWFELEVDGEIVLRSDVDWRTRTGPICFDGLRNGEFYDARLELGEWATAAYEAHGWRVPPVVPPPGGVMEEQTSPPCRVMQQLPAREITPVPGGWRVDFGQNVAGWSRIQVKGPAGGTVKIVYLERLKPDGLSEASGGLADYVLSGEFQTDRYTLNGEGTEEWAPRFTYHGFRYILVLADAAAITLCAAQACAVWSSFAQVGDFDSSNPVLNRLQSCALWSYRGNFVGIPTDCPHREKNGWTGDAQLAVETGLWLCDSASSYAQWLDTWSDCQRPSGQLPAIAPSAGWGFNWGSGPAWDSAFLTIPWYIYLFTGDDAVIRRHFDRMRRYMDFCGTMATGDLVGFGLGDWCAPGRVAGYVASEFTSSAWYFADAERMACFARHLGRPEVASEYEELAERIRLAFHRKFYHGDGLYGTGTLTELAAPLYQGLATAKERGPTEVRLIQKALDGECVADFGILGARYTLRALAQAGRVDLAYRMIVQEKYPGWAYWVRQFDATTLLEHWEGDTSANHIMFGDFSAWCMQYLGGIAPDPENPGFRYFTIQPSMVAGLTSFSAWHQAPNGRIASEWEIVDGEFQLTVTVPVGSAALVTLPDGTRQEVEPGRRKFSMKS